MYLNCSGIILKISLATLLSLYTHPVGYIIILRITRMYCFHLAKTYFVDPSFIKDEGQSDRKTLQKYQTLKSIEECLTKLNPGKLHT